MITKPDKTTFKCKQCGYKFEAIYIEGGFLPVPNLPHCPKCGSNEIRKATLLDKVV